MSRANCMRPRRRHCSCSIGDECRWHLLTRNPALTCDLSESRPQAVTSVRLSSICLLVQDGRKGAEVLCHLYQGRWPSSRAAIAESAWQPPNGSSLKEHTSSSRDDDRLN